MSRTCTVFAPIVVMHTIVLSPRLFGFVVATRAALAAGVALLVASRMPADTRRAVGSALFVVGVATTIPAVWWIRQSMPRQARRPTNSGFGADRHLIGAERFPRKGDDLSVGDEIAW